MPHLNLKDLPKGLEKFFNSVTGQAQRVKNPHITVGGTTLADLATSGYVWVMGDLAGLTEKGENTLKAAMKPEKVPA